MLKEAVAADEHFPGGPVGVDVPEFLEEHGRPLVLALVGLPQVLGSDRLGQEILDVVLQAVAPAERLSLGLDISGGID